MAVETFGGVFKLISKKNDEKKLMVNKYNIKDKIMAMYVLLDNLLVSITFVFFPR
jgi:hypothetical protein